MMGDMHYATDVIVGSVMGTAIGFLVPVLHEQIFGERDLAPNAVHISVVPTGTGVSVVGAF
jgi:membrane-associated phospholipid phosphatase